MAAFPYNKRGLAVIINNSYQQNLDFQVLTMALKEAKYEISIFNNLTTLDELTYMISQLNFPLHVNHKILQRIKNKSKYERINDNRQEIYSQLVSKPNKNDIKKMCNEMNMYQQSPRDSAKSIKNNLDPSLLVIYLGQSFTRDGILLKKNNTFSKISHNHFISLFRQEFTNIPPNVCQIFTFATISIQPPIKDMIFEHHNIKERKCGTNNIININLMNKLISFQRFICFFASFVRSNKKSIKNIETFLKKPKTDFIASYILKLQTHYKLRA